MMSPFPNTRTTYQPKFVSEPALLAFGRADYEKLVAEIRRAPQDSYERVSVDRALAIAVDLAMQEVPVGAAILDIGCAEGLVCALLARLGYKMTGIDNDLVGDVQGWYDLTARTGARDVFRAENCEYIETDAVGFLTSLGNSYEVILLLSVLHHFLEGYGGSGSGAISAKEFDEFLRLICHRARRCLYVEVPLSDEGVEMPQDRRYPIPEYFVSSGLAVSFELVASTIATNAKPRRLYRVNLV